jgi:hypothetical protein
VVGRRLGSRNDALLALAGGLCATVAMWHLQVRYFLPGEALACIIVAHRGSLWRFSL